MHKSHVCDKESTTLQGQLKFVDLFELWGNRGPRALLVIFFICTIFFVAFVKEKN